MPKILFFVEITGQGRAPRLSLSRSPCLIQRLPGSYGLYSSPTAFYQVWFCEPFVIIPNIIVVTLVTTIYHCSGRTCPAAVFPQIPAYYYYYLLAIFCDLCHLSDCVSVTGQSPASQITSSPPLFLPTTVQARVAA